MDMNSFIRGFFGFNRMNPDRFDSFSDHPFGKWRNSHEDHDGVKDDFESHFDDGFPDIFQQMEDMFSSVFSMHSGFLDFPNLEIQQDPGSPRDLMLREPNSGHCERGQCQDARQELIDSDLDDKVARGGLSTLEEGNLFSNRQPKSQNTHSFHKSVSSKIIRSADGVVEEHRTTRDSSGRTVTTIRKSIGDQTYQVTTESDSSGGVIEKKEDLINMDEKDISSFEEKFSQSRKFQPQPIEPRPVEMLPPAPPGDSKYWSIFKRFFG